MDATKTVVYVGKTVKYNGKRLFDILCRMKNFGIGRIVYRQSELDAYPEACYTRVTKVKPDMSDPTQASLDSKVKSFVWGQKVYRGNDLGEKILSATFKADWKFVAKEDEKEFLEKMALKAVHKKSERPKETKFPPLLEKMILRNNPKSKVIPMLPLITVNNEYPLKT